MSRERGRDDTRRAIAAHAARLMAQDGIEDYGLAKRKAARQLGIPDARRLPNNDEIDAALREYRDIYRDESQDLRLRGLRGQALRAMREFANFDPHLTGSVLSGSAGPYAVICLQLYADNPKAVELFLIDRGIGYKTGESRLYAGNELRVLPVFAIKGEDADIELTVLDPRDLRTPLRATAEGRIIERVRPAAVEALLQ
jgi:hypothetical protein